MHLYLLSRGVKNRMSEWENDLGAQWMPLQYKMPDGKITQGRIKLAIREVKLHEVVFPAGYEKQVMSLIDPGTGDRNFGKWTKWIRRLSKFLKLKPPLTEWPENNMIHADGISTIALGTMEDKMNFHINTPVQKDGIIPQENL